MKAKMFSTNRAQKNVAIVLFLALASVAQGALCDGRARFLSTAEDLALFGSALLQPGFLQPESLRQLFTSQKTSHGKETGYGIGWFVGRSKSGQKVYAHDGGAGGGSSRLLLYLDAHVAVAMICNFEGGGQADEVESVGEAFETK